VVAIPGATSKSPSALEPSKDEPSRGTTVPRNNRVGETGPKLPGEYQSGDNKPETRHITPGQSRGEAGPPDHICEEAAATLKKKNGKEREPHCLTQSQG